MSRPRAGSRPPDITYLTEIVRKVGYQPSIEIGLVMESEDGGDHWDMDAEDLIVTVELVPSGRQLPCRVMAPAGGPNQGVWSIPPEGAEVVVAIPGGDSDEGGVVIGCLSTGAVPVGLGDDKVVIAAVNSAYLGGTEGAERTYKADALLTALDTLITQIAAAFTSIPASAGSAGATIINSAKTAFDQAAEAAKTTIARVK